MSQANQVGGNVLSFKPALHIPPQSVDMEEAILGGLLLDSNAIERVEDILSSQMFYLSAHGLIYRAIVALRKQEKPCDLTYVALWLGDNDLLDRVGGANKLVSLVESTVSAVNIDFYAEAIAQKFRRREYIKLFQGFIEDAHNEKIPQEQFEESVNQKLVEMAMDNELKGGLKSFEDVLTRRIEEIEQVAMTGVPLGVKTGFYDLDEVVNCKLGDLIIVAGRPAMGKSAFVASMARNVMRDKHVALFSLEMSGGQVSDRLLSIETGINSSKFQDASLTDKDWETIGHGTASLLEQPNLWIDDGRSVGLNHIRKQCTIKKAQGNLDCIVIDYLHLMLDSDEDDAVREIAKLTRGFKKLAGDLNVPVYLLSQLSRSLESRSDKRPIMSDLRGSGAIEQDADTILFLYRDEVYNPDSPDRGTAEVIIGKQRGGAIGTIKLLFEPHLTRFRNLANVKSPSPSTVPKKPNTPSSPQTSPAKKEPAKVAVIAPVQSPPEPDEVEGFRRGDRVEVTLDNFDKRTRNEIKKQDDCSLVGLKGTIVSFRFSDFGGNHFDPVIAFDGAKGSFNKAAIYLRKLNDSECDDF